MTSETPRRPQISLFASAVRPKLWESFFASLKSNVSEIEVVFAGNAFEKVLGPIVFQFKNGQPLKYIITENIKPAQCYEIARRHCTGAVVVWVADDCEFPNGVLDKAYTHWKSKNNEKLILSIQTKESGYNLPEGQLFNMSHHCFFGFQPDTPLMAPLGMMSREYLDKLGGIDRRYVCGQYENDIVMRAYADGGTVEIFGGGDCYIDIDHLGKSFLIGESRNQSEFLQRPFAKGYNYDRGVLEKSWTTYDPKKIQTLLAQGPINLSRMKFVVKQRNDTFEPFEDKDLLTKSQGEKGIWE